QECQAGALRFLLPVFEALPVQRFRFRETSLLAVEFREIIHQRDADALEIFTGLAGEFDGFTIERLGIAGTARRDIQGGEIARNACQVTVARGGWIAVPDIESAEIVAFGIREAATIETRCSQIV